MVSYVITNPVTAVKTSPEPNNSLSDPDKYIIVSVLSGYDTQYLSVMTNE